MPTENEMEAFEAGENAYKRGAAESDALRVLSPKSTPNHSHVGKAYPKQSV